MSQPGEFTAAVADALTTGTGIVVQPHKQFSGPVDKADAGCAWGVTVEEDEDNNSIAYITVKARVFKNKKGGGGRRSGRAVPSSLELEDLAELVQTSIRDTFAQLDGVWYARVSTVEIDHEEWGVEATIVGRTLNVGIPY